MDAKLIKALQEKVAKEQDEYRDWLLSQPQKEVLNYALEYAIREGIVEMLDEDTITLEWATMLLKLKKPVAEVFSHWRNHQVGYLEGIRDALNRCADYTSRSRYEASKRRER